jgi:hypothetical protein
VEAQAHGRRRATVRIAVQTTRRHVDPFPPTTPGSTQRRPVPEGGFGLVETVVAFAVLLLVLLATAAVVTNVLGQASNGRSATAAGGIAEATLNQISKQPISTIDDQVDRTITLPPQTVGGETFTIQQYLTWQAGSSPSPCQSGQPPIALQATVTVSWNHDQQHLSESAVVDPPYSNTEANQGDLAVQIQSAANPDQPPADVQAVTVAVDNSQGQNVANATPDPTGCVYLALPAGSYTVSVQSPATPVFVDQSNQTTSAPQTVSVSAGQLSQIAVPFDQAAHVSFVPASAAPPALAGLPVTVVESGLPTGSQVVVPANSASQGPVPLFPFPSGYHAYFGDCAAEAPSAPSGFATSPGETETAQIAGLEPLDLSITATGAGPIKGTLTLDPPSGSSCPADSFTLGPLDLQGHSGQLDTQILAYPATVSLTDQSDGATTSLKITWDQSTSSWQVAQNGATTSYPVGQPIPVSIG